VKRGDVFWAECVPRSARTSRPPAGDRGLARRIQPDPTGVIIVVPVSTSESQGRRGLTVVALPTASAGLPQDSVAVCHQVIHSGPLEAVAATRRLPFQDSREVEQALKAALDLE